MFPTKPLALRLGLSLLLGLPLPALADRNSTGSRVQAPAVAPYDSPIQRANPNSQQGSVIATPPLPSPSTQPQRTPPTLENRGIGNGNNLRREQQRPTLEPARPSRGDQRAP